MKEIEPYNEIYTQMVIEDLREKTELSISDIRNALNYSTDPPVEYVSFNDWNDLLRAVGPLFFTTEGEQIKKSYYDDIKRGYDESGFFNFSYPEKIPEIDIEIVVNTKTMKDSIILSSSLARDIPALVPNICFYGLSVQNAQKYKNLFMNKVTIGCNNFNKNHIGEKMLQYLPQGSFLHQLPCFCSVYSLTNNSEYLVGITRGNCGLDIILNNCSKIIFTMLTRRKDYKLVFTRYPVITEGMPSAKDIYSECIIRMYNKNV